MSKTIFKLALLSDDDCDFTFFTNLCQNLPDLDISLRFISPQTRLDIDEISHEIPPFLFDVLPGFKEGQQVSQNTV